MKPKITVFALSALLLASCGSAPIPETSSSQESKEPETSSSPSQPSSSSSEETIDEELPVREGRPHISDLDHLKRHRFQGKWIWEAKDIADTHVAFRKSIRLAAKPRQAILHISAESKATVFINGSLHTVDAVLKRGPTPFDAFYQDIDVTAALKEGDNVLCILVHYWGKNGNSSISADKGGLLFDLDVDGILYSSDANVKVKRIDAYRNQRVLMPTGEYPDRKRDSFLAEQEIYYDARREEAFYALDYDDSAWADATFVASPGYLPFGDLYLGDIPGFTLEEVKDAADVGSNLNKKFEEDAEVVFSLPENMQFLPYLELESEEEGAHLTIRTDTYITTNLPSLMDDYRAKAGHNVYQQLYWRSGMKIILTVPKGVTLKRVGYRRSEYNVNTRAHFDSNIDALDVLFDKAYNTVRICMRDTFMDCPERERSPYAGDSSNQIDEALYSMGEDGWKMIQKTYQTLSGWAKDDGTFPLRWPSVTSNECPMQNLAFLITIPNYLHHTGDEETVKKIFPIAEDYLKKWNLNADGSVEYRDGSFQWTDWGSGMDNDLMENGWYHWALRSTLLLAESLGMDQNRSFYEERMRKIEGAFYPKFKKEGGFASKSRNTYDDRGNALAVLSGLVNKEDYPLVKDVLRSVETASPYMERYVEQAMAEIGDLEGAATRMANRFADMISSEYTTLWELWSLDPKTGGTPNHGWTGGSLVVLSEYFAGIKPTSKGYGTYDIVPSHYLSDIETSVYTPKGEIVYAYHRGQSGTVIEIDAQDGGTLRLDESADEVLSAEGSIAANGDGTYALSKGKATITLK